MERPQEPGDVLPDSLSFRTSSYSYSSIVTHRYRAYGLEVDSSSRIEALELAPSGDEKFDLRFEEGPEPGWARLLLSLPSRLLKRRLEPAGVAEPSVVLREYGNEEGFELAYADGTRFVIDGAAERVWATYEPPTTQGVMLVCFLGPVMGFLLRRRHITSLHASCIALQGQAIAFCGEAGFGKSTTAAALALRGLPVVAEDVVPLQESAGQFLTIPGYPRVCLWPESVQMLLGSEDALPLIAEGWEKRYLALDGQRARFAAGELPLALLYVFAPRVNEPGAPRIETLGAREAVLELVPNTYMNWVLDPQQRAEEFDILCRLVKQVSVRRIVPHADPEKMAGLCDLILRDAQTFLSSREKAPESIRR
jgi:hypothetical protein